MLAAALTGLLLLAVTLEPGTIPGYGEHDAWVLVDIVAGVVAIGLLPLRRRHPLAIAVLLIVLTAGTTTTVGAAGIALISLCAHRRWRRIVPASLLWLAAGTVFEWLHPSSQRTADQITSVIIGLLSVGFCVAIGLFIGARRELITSLHERADTAEREQSLRVAQARVGERARIAREMHDVLAHRISLVAMHSGALTYRDDLTAQQVREAAEVIQQNAQLALTELRDVLGVLREAPALAARPEAPQPRLCDLHELVRSDAEAGEQVDLRVPIDLNVVPETLSRNAFRIIQESLTNARKHAPGQPVTVHVDGVAGDRLTVQVHNPLPTTGDAMLPESGLGLIGLTERAVLSGGGLRAGVDRSKRAFVVSAWLPWSRAER